MNRTLTLLFAAAAFSVSAQVPNAGFETFNDSGNISSWGQFYAVPFVLDIETGESYSPIVWDGDAGFVFSSNDAYIGDHAMEIRNAFDTVGNVLIPGMAQLFDSAVSQEATAFNYGIPLPANSEIDHFSFYYKFMPLGADTAQARLDLFDENDWLVGSAVIDIHGTGNAYVQAFEPVTFLSNEEPVFMTITFSMAKEGSDPAFGSRMLIDGIDTGAPLGIDELDRSQMLVSPSPAESGVRISVPGTEPQTLFVSLTDVSGKKVLGQNLAAGETLDISTLPSGIYTVSAIARNNLFTGRVVRQ
jgi:hypothetical protein